MSNFPTSRTADRRPRCVRDLLRNARFYVRLGASRTQGICASSGEFDAGDLRGGSADMLKRANGIMPLRKMSCERRT